MVFSRIEMIAFVAYTSLWLIPIVSGESTASFKGSEYVEYKITEAPIESSKDKVTLRFKTTEAFGVLVYSCGEQGDFLLLELKRGKILYTGNFGSTDGTSGVHEIVLDHQYNDNKWHDVTLLRENGTHVFLTVDDVTRTRDTRSGFEQLNLDTYLYVGGFGEYQRLDTNCHDNVGKKNFIGCLANVRFNSVDLLYGAIEEFSTFKTHGHLSFSCPENDYNIFGLYSESSVLTVKRDILSKNQLQLEIEMRTFEPNGHIATHLSTMGGVDLDLISGRVHLTMSFLGLATKDETVESAVLVNDGDWHTIKVIVKRNESTINLNVDDEKKMYTFQKHFKLSKEMGLFMANIRFGGNTPQLPGLVTCFRKLLIDGNQLSFSSKSIEMKRHIVEQCRIKDACFPNPCQHSSTCSQSQQRAICNCNNTDYTGKQCESCIHKRSCQEIKESGQTVSGTYKICPNNERVFPVYCNMNSGATVIKHNTDNDTRVGDGKIIRASISFYYHDIQYFVTKDAIMDLLSVSIKCQQYIRYDCKSSRLLFDVGRFRHVHLKGARWLSRDSQVQYYWGGATPESRKCACGMSRSCAKDNRGKMKDCNCDVGDSKWRFDAGFLQDKKTLPVTHVQFSIGAETNQDSFFTVGELKCYGTTSLPTNAPKKTPMAMTDLRPSIIDRNSTKHLSNGTITVEKVQAETIDSLLSKPWLITIVIVGALLCLLLVSLVLLLFKQQLNDILMKCIYGDHISKPRIEIEDYNRYSTATEDQSDWDIYRLSTTFPTSTPEPSYTITDDESARIRVRTLEDIRGKRKFKRLSGWGSRTASAPTVVGGSKPNIQDSDDDNFSFRKENNNRSIESSQPYNTSSDSKQVQSLCRSNSMDTEVAYSTTATDGEADSVIDTNSEFSHHSQNSSMKESECTLSPKQSQTQRKYYSMQERPKNLSINSDNALNAIHKAPHKNGTTAHKEHTKAYYPILPVNGFRQPVVRCAHPVEYSTHVQMLNNNGGRCQLANGPITRLVPVNRRPSVASDAFPLYAHPTIQEHSEEYSDDEDVITYDNARNSDGFYELYEREHDSPSSETRLLFDDVSSREECEREADEQIKLLKKKVIEKATSADECCNP